MRNRPGRTRIPPSPRNARQPANRQRPRLTRARVAGYSGTMRFALILLVLLAAASAAPARADTFRLRSGGTVQGKIVEENEVEYQVETRVGKIRVKKSDVVSLERGEVPVDGSALRSRMRALLALLGENRWVAARLRWDELKAVPSPAWSSREAQAAMLTELGWEPPGGAERSFDALFAHLDGLTHDLCFPCEAVGTRECAACGGHGKLPCAVCNRRPPACDTCAGKGLTDCPDCEKKGKVRCPGCADSKEPGYHRTEETRRVMLRLDPIQGPVYGDRTFVRKSMCGECKGQGSAPCQTCAVAGPTGKPTPGKVPCPDCEGDGRLECAGGCDAGTRPDPCAACAGRGRSTCPDCGGSGKKPEEKK